MSPRLRYGLAALCILSGLGLLAHPWWTGVEERAGQQRLASEFNATAPAPARTPAPAAVPPGSPVRVLTPRGKPELQPELRPLGHWRPPGPPPRVYARLNVPAIGLQVYVVDGATLTDYYDQLAWGPAHLKGSPRPGGVGNSVIFGHVDEFGSPFRLLYRLKKGDLIVLSAGGERYRYRVTRVWSVVPTDTAIAAPIPRVRDLTLFTCTGLANTRRLIVRAALAGSVPAAA